MAYDMLIIAAHPDDAEVQMGGTIAKLTRAGQRILIADLCDGEPADYAPLGTRREQALRAFRTGKVDVLVATDVAARGIDVDNVTHVINYECPDDEKTYLHRIGRTGRVNNTGEAFTLFTHEDRDMIKALEKIFKKPIETRKLERLSGWGLELAWQRRSGWGRRRRAGAGPDGWTAGRWPGW